MKPASEILHHYILIALTVASCIATLQSALGDSRAEVCQTNAETLAVVSRIDTRTQSVEKSIAATTSNSAFDASNIEEFLETCPQSDAALPTILRDFKIRRMGQLVSPPACTEPVSDLPLADFTDELITLQALRVIYYMDQFKSGHLPWTDASLYTWMASKIAGIDIRDTPGAFCCVIHDGELYIVVPSHDEQTRAYFRSWGSMSLRIALFAHETRHVGGFGHVSCCGISRGCDQQFDPENLSPYGIQWWLHSLWADGNINVGYSCFDDAAETASTHIGICNDALSSRFCENPPEVLSDPEIPGGLCELNAFNELVFSDGFEE